MDGGRAQLQELRACGAGIYTSIKGAVYKGEYDRGNRHGWGEYVNSAGDVYQGQWSGNARHGQAVVTTSRDVPELARELNPAAHADLRRWAQVRGGRAARSRCAARV